MPHFIQIVHLKLFFDAFGYRIALIMVLYLIGALIEEHNKRGDAPARSEVMINVGNMLIYQGADLTLGVATVIGLKFLVDQLPFHPPIRFGSSSIQTFAVGCLFILTHDFFYYWMHRLQHASKWLWAEHELHHSDEHVNITSSFRQHWVDTILSPLFILAPVLLLFDPSVSVAVWITLLYKGVNYFAHLNFPIGFGWFNRVLSTPQTHRIHHSYSPEHIDKNFAALFPLWDILFGTYYHPHAHEWPSTGVAGVKVTSLWQAIVLPFVSWNKMLRRSTAA